MEGSESQVLLSGTLVEYIDGVEKRTRVDIGIATVLIAVVNALTISVILYLWSRT